MWEGRGFDGRRPQSSNKRKQQQKQRQQQAATGTQATRKAATSSRIRCSTNSRNNNPQKVRAKRCGSRRWVRASSSRISVVFEAFFLDASKICNSWSLTFSEVLWSVKLFLTFCQSHRGFHTTAREPRRAQFAPTLQTTKIPREDFAEREKKGYRHHPI